MRLASFIIRLCAGGFEENNPPDGISKARWRAMLVSCLDHEHWANSPHGD